jgi:hypothetical protein
MPSGRLSAGGKLLEDDIQYQARGKSTIKPTDTAVPVKLVDFDGLLFIFQF